MRRLGLETWNQTLLVLLNDTRLVVCHDASSCITISSFESISSYISCDPHSNLLTKAGQSLLAEELTLQLLVLPTFSIL